MATTGTDSFPQDDAYIVRELRSDNAEALQALMTAYWEPLVGFAQRTLANAGDPEDMVQTSFVRLWAKRRDLSESGSLKSLLYTMVRNSCLDELRRRTRQHRAQEGAAKPPPPRTPYEDVQGAELQRLAAAAVSRLPEKRRAVFRMVREEGLSYKEVAEIMGLSPQTIANHMSLAMADLRAALRPFVTERTTRGTEETGATSHRERMDG